jgi:ComF family protein
MLLAQRGPGLLGRRAYECIMPVPLHTARLRQRGFNQSLVLARCVGRAWQIPVAAEVLIKLRPTQPQTLLPLAQRRRNVRGAFACSGRLRYTRVLLVDDVYTSGSTAHECARVLKRHGVEQVDVLTLARTP